MKVSDQPNAAALPIEKIFPICIGCEAEWAPVLVWMCGVE
jgi:hypothetical protein